MRSTLLGLCLVPACAIAQPYTSYFTGNTTDVATTPLGGLCLMGGATESDPAMVWFLERASGGDVLVLRASGSDGYNDYMYSELGVTLNSVETIVCNSASASNDPYVHQRIQKAEAIWFAGGDQWNYVSYWQNTPVDSLVREAIAQRNIVIGGTSAGMAILGGYRFTAQNGAVASATALNNPYTPQVTLDGSTFMNAPGMNNVVTDSHFDDPDRRGRLLTFIARSYADNGTPAFGLACNEYVAVCIGDDGIAHVYGDYPNYDEFAWFVQASCDVMLPPETCGPGTPLTWDHNGLAVKACKVPGTQAGMYTFDMNDRKTTNGGLWEDWSAVAGTLVTASGTAPACNVGLAEAARPDWRCIPTADGIRLTGMTAAARIELVNVSGQVMPCAITRTSDGALVHWEHNGLVLVRVMDAGAAAAFRVVR